jgi:selenocysteine lyase/cysteine desulfurase
MPEPAKVAAVRTLLPATGAGIYLNAALAGPMPSETQRAMDEQAQRELTTGRGHPDLVFETLERVAEARAAVAAVLVADPDDVALVHGAVDGLALVLEPVARHAGDRILTTAHEAAGTSQLLELLRDRHGLELEVVDIDTEVGEVAVGDEDRIVAAFNAALDRPARAIVVSHVLPTTGAVLPVARIGELARAAGATLVVDGSQAAGAVPVSVEELGVDAYAVPAEAWLLGPEGMGAVWRRRGSATATVPGGLHRPSVVGFARSCGWLSMYVGLPWAMDRAARLAADVHERLASIDGVTVLTPRDRMATLVSFRIAGWTADAALAELERRVFAIMADVPALDALRISVGFWSTDEELDRFAEAIELLARHTPATLPPRRTLTILGTDDRPLG